jgi:hypothetical protein
MVPTKHYVRNRLTKFKVPTIKHKLIKERAPNIIESKPNNEDDKSQKRDAAKHP